MKKIYVLHEYGCREHLNALCYLAEKENIRIIYCEFNLIEQLKKRPFNVKRFLHNILFLSFLIFAPPQKIILGIAPVNHALKLILKLYKRHNFFYHTSYTYWDFKTVAHNPHDSQDLKVWTHFIENVTNHIFAVSKKTKKELCSNFNIDPSKISVVNHAYKEAISPNKKIPYKNTYISVGELSYRKGTLELLDYFAGHPEHTLTLIGRGNLSKTAQAYSQKYNNIYYKGYISNWSTLESNYKENLFLILNSHKTKQWEELFGMVLIEGMACGCIPLATNHTGPQEIITSGINGFLYKEGEIERIIEKTSSLDDKAIIAMRAAAIKEGQQYSIQNKSSSWEAILK